MRRRQTTQDERALFEKAFAESRPLKPVATAKASRGKTAKPSPTGGLDGRTSERLKRGLVEPDARLDLHGYTEDAAHSALLLFLKSARLRGTRLVLVVTGKGAPSGEDGFSMSVDKPRGVLKTAVPRWLKEPGFAELIAGAQGAHRRHGGAGALYVYLRKRER